MSSEQHPWFRYRSGAVFLGFIAIAAFFLWEEHMAHILGILPFADVIICKVAPWDPAKCREKAVDAISVLKARGLASLLKSRGGKPYSSE